MAESTNEADLLRQAHVRLCRLCLWSNFEGLGLHLQPSTSPPHIINMIESNSPAAASGLRIWDIILSVNYHDMSQESYERVQKAIKVACNDVIYVDLLVVEKKYYKSLKSQNIDIDFTLATVITAPAKMPIDFAKFPKLIPRIYNLRLGQNDTAFGFNIANGENDVGAYIQTIYPDTPASDAGLRKSDRIIEINDRNVERRSGEYIDKKLRKAKAKGTIKLFVADTHTYEYYMKHNMKFSSTEPQTDRKQKKDDEHIAKQDSDNQVINDSRDLSNNKNYDDNKSVYSSDIIHRSQSISDFQDYHTEKNYYFYSTPKGSSLITETTRATRTNDYYHNAEDILTSNAKSSTLRYQSLTDLRESDQSIRKKSPVTNDVINVSNGTIQICCGDITEQKVDTIIVASTSDCLRENVLKEAGNSVRATYDTEKQRKTNTTICTHGGKLACKRIYFIPCSQISRNADKWIFRNFVSEAIKNAANDHSTRIQSLAFPAIGCGQYGCDSNFVGKTLIMAVAYELEHQPSLQLHVHFVIQQNQQKIFDAFRNQLIALQNNGPTYRTDQSFSIVTHLPPEPPPSQNKIKGFIVEKRLFNKSSDEYTMVMKEFMSTMTSNLYSKILRIEIVWNERWYKQYMIHKEEFSQRLKNDTEKHLFHGCSESAANSIMKECFNRSYAGVHGTAYGYGVYFSSKASYSHSYATANTKGERCMFLANVLIGKTTVGNSSMKHCPVGYDTTTDGSHIYVVYHDAQTFGHYLITYK